ncbi:MAG: undecaprenyl-phosphate glucose phosphotransferase [Endozoicomonadaceae bacterium]|nr:undecaprenyl-phosphate glucose phosphotransferase [Endozoicomonadaceae bacterium]MCY4329388.1 undecaprenyl-phosphate glucose phosphotransferase [Endozoicomonadaceae bacterium]
MRDRIHISESSITWVYRLLDLITPLVSVCLIVYVLKVEPDDRYLILSCYGGLSFLILSQYTGVYKGFNNTQFLSVFPKVIISWMISWMVLIVALFLLKKSELFSRFVLALWAFNSLIVAIIAKIVIRHLILKIIKKLIAPKKIAIVGVSGFNNKLASLINKKIINIQIEFFHFETEELEQKVNNSSVNNKLKKLLENAKKCKYAEIYICLPLKEEVMIKLLLDQLNDTSAVVKLMPDIFKFNLMYNKITDMGGVPVFSVYDTPLNAAGNKIIKRMFDLFLSMIILILISPVILLIAIGIKISSPGNIFYRQTRIGWHGKKFTMLKFRSLPMDTEKSTLRWGNGKDKTKTKFGKFIRATSLDELPQFINVLKGDMSIVGPRPERDMFVEKFRKDIPGYMQKHMVKAGITGWAQINGWRGDTCLRKRIKYDLYYIKNWSLWLDIKIIFLTVLKGFINKNAY